MSPARPRRARDRRSGRAPRRWRCRNSRSSPAAAGPRGTTGARHRQRDDPQRPAVLVGHASRAAPGSPAAARSSRRRIVLDHRDDRVGLDEAGQVVDVAVGVVAHDAVAEPEDLRHAEEVAQVALDLRSRRAPGLRFGLSRHASVVSSVPRPFTSIEPPSMHYARREHRQPELRADAGRDDVVEIEGRILAAPGVVAPVDDRLLAAARRSRATKIGPWSRHQASLVGCGGRDTVAEADALVGEQRRAPTPPWPDRPR